MFFRCEEGIWYCWQRMSMVQTFENWDNGDFIRAIQSLYKSVSCTVKINDNFTEWFQVYMGVKQGRALSLTYLSICKWLSSWDEKHTLRGCLWWYFYLKLTICRWHSINSWKRTRPEKNVECIVRGSKNGELILMKRKVLHFRPATKQRSNFTLKCASKHIKFDDIYKYLGFWFHESLDMKKSIKEISKSASRAPGAVYMK